MLLLRWLFRNKSTVNSQGVRALALAAVVAAIEIALLVPFSTVLPPISSLERALLLEVALAVAALPVAALALALGALGSQMVVRATCVAQTLLGMGALTGTVTCFSTIVAGAVEGALPAIALLAALVPRVQVMRLLLGLLLCLLLR